MNDDIAIKAENVSKDFVLSHQGSNSVKGVFTSMFQKATEKKEKQHALKGISFEIKKGEFFGIVGRNGSGKSTLLKILAGIYQPTKGSVAVSGKLVPFIELGVGFNLELSGRDNVYLNGAMLGFNKSEVAAMYDDIVAFAELERFMDQKLKNYSSGMQVRLAFSMAVRAEADILLVDEVLAVGDADFQRKCFQYFHLLKRNKKTVVFVSHDMDGIRQYCDEALLIEDSKIQAHGSGEDVADLYTQLFLENKTGDIVATQGDRWGDGGARIQRIDVRPHIITDTTKEIIISWQTIAKTTIEKPLHGFIIKNSDGNGIIGTNTKLSKIKVPAMNPGDKVSVEWAIPNIFSEGIYSIAPAIASMDDTVHDWWESATNFEVRRAIRSPYPVQPEVVGKVQAIR